MSTRHSIDEMVEQAVAVEVAANGNATPPVDPMIPGKRIAPRRERWVSLPEAEYPGFAIKLWVNAPTRYWRGALEGETRAEKIASIGKIVLAHNGWCDTETEEELPPPADPAFWDAISDEQASCIILLLRDEQNRLPNSMSPSNGRSARG